MNKDRRKQLEDVRDSLDEIISSLNDIKDEEQDAYDNMPESLQSSDKGSRMTMPSILLTKLSLPSRRRSSTSTKLPHKNNKAACTGSFVRTIILYLHEPLKATL